MACFTSPHLRSRSSCTASRRVTRPGRALTPRPGTACWASPGFCGFWPWWCGRHVVAACGRLFPTGTIAAHFRPWTGSRRLGGLTGGIFRRRLRRPCGEGPRRMTIGGRRLTLWRRHPGSTGPRGRCWHSGRDGAMILVRIRDEVICQLRERVQDAADLTADWLQGDLFALPVFLRLLEDLGYATAALRQDLEDGFDMLGEVRQAPLEAAGRRAVRQPVPPGNSPGEGGMAGISWFPPRPAERLPPVGGQAPRPLRHVPSLCRRDHTVVPTSPCASGRRPASGTSTGRRTPSQINGPTSAPLGPLRPLRCSPAASRSSGWPSTTTSPASSPYNEGLWARSTASYPPFGAWRRTGLGANVSDAISQAPRAAQT